jgi:hypothetical protein
LTLSLRLIFLQALPSLFKGGSNIDRFDVLETPSHLDPKTSELSVDGRLLKS